MKMMDIKDVKDVLSNVHIISNGSHTLEEIAEAFDIIEDALEQVADKPKKRAIVMIFDDVKNEIHHFELSHDCEYTIVYADKIDEWLAHVERPGGGK